MDSVSGSLAYLPPYTGEVAGSQTPQTTSEEKSATSELPGVVVGLGAGIVPLQNASGLLAGPSSRAARAAGPARAGDGALQAGVAAAARAADPADAAAAVRLVVAVRAARARDRATNQEEEKRKES